MTVRHHQIVNELKYQICKQNFISNYNYSFFILSTVLCLVTLFCLVLCIFGCFTTYFSYRGKAIFESYYGLLTSPSIVFTMFFFDNVFYIFCIMQIKMNEWMNEWILIQSTTKWLIKKHHSKTTKSKNKTKQKYKTKQKKPKNKQTNKQTKTKTDKHTKTNKTKQKHNINQKS